MFCFLSNECLLNHSDFHPTTTEVPGYANCAPIADSEMKYELPLCFNIDYNRDV
jgi:hypothetical protein